MKFLPFLIAATSMLALANVVSAAEVEADANEKIVLTQAQLDSVTAGTHMGFNIDLEIEGLRVVLSSFATSSTYTICRNGACTTFGFGGS